MMEEQKNYYAIIPANVRYDKNLKDKAKLLYGEITALCNEKGYCWANNEYFANLYGISKTTVSLLIKNLIDNGYIYSEIIYKDGTKEILNRYLSIVKYPIKEKLNTPIKEKLKDNNTVINNTINNLYKNSKKFVPPTLEEIENYCKEKNYNIDTQFFYEYFTEGNWVDSKGNKVKNWKQKIITWSKGKKTENKPIKNEWFDKKIEKEELSQEEEEEMKSILNKY